MKKLYVTLFTVTVFASGGGAQTILTGGFGTDGMGVVNGNTYTKTSNLGNGGFPFVAASNGTFYASSPSTSKLYFIDGNGSAMVDSMNIYVRNLSSFNEPNTLFSITDRALCRINTSTKTLIDSIQLGAPWQLTERPNNKEVWVTDSGKVHVVDYTSGLSSTTFTLSALAYDYGAIAFTPGGTVAYKATSAAQKLYKINAATRAILDSVTTAPYGYNNMVVSHDSSKLYVCNPNNNMVMIYNTSGLSLVDSVQFPTRTPMNIYRHPSRQEIWVIHHFNDSASVLNENTNAQIAAFGISGSPWYIAFGSATTSVIDASLSAIGIYPNPANNDITITGLTENGTATIYDLSGRQVAQHSVSTNEKKINIARLSSGYYVLKVTGEKGDLKKCISFEKR